MKQIRSIAQFVAVLSVKINVVSARIGTPRNEGGQTIETKNQPGKAHEASVGRDGGVQFKIFWEQGIMWQESSSTMAWCAECRGGCTTGDVVVVRECSDDNKRQIWFYDHNSSKIKSSANQTLCFTYSGTHEDARIKLRRCGRSRDTKQKWTGFDAESKFQLHPESNANMCMTPDHHPRSDEWLKLESCQIAQENDRGIYDDTSHWVIGQWDGHHDGCDDRSHWLDGNNALGQCTGNSLYGSGRLIPNQYICTEDGNGRFGLDGRGVLVAMKKRKHSWNTYWVADQGGKSGDFVLMQRDGNLVVYTNCGRAVWASNTVGNSNAYLLISNFENDDSKVQILRMGHVLWSPSEGTPTGMLAVTPAGTFSGAIPANWGHCLGWRLVGTERLSRDQYICSGNHSRFGLTRSGHLVFEIKGSGSAWATHWKADQKGPGEYVLMQADGNLVVYTNDQIPLWASHTSGEHGVELQIVDVLRYGGQVQLVSGREQVIWSPHGTSVEENNGKCKGKTLVSRRRLWPDQYICNEGSDNRFGLDTNGNLVAMRMHDNSWRTYWKADQNQRAGEFVIMQADGNLVVNDRNKRPVWASGTMGNANAFLIFDDKVGYARIARSGNMRTLWSTDENA